uniref:Receptor kinase-like protein Xa21 n=1 Tax=Aegilops tauschii TaxID=37682 RepID=R7WE77_AEGTA
MPSNSTGHKESLVLKVVIPIASLVSLAMVIFGLLLSRGKHKSKSLSLPSFVTKFPQVSFNDLARATEVFSTSNLIGKGSYGSVYKGKLVHDEKEVAVKVFNLETRGAHKSFIAECNMLRNVRHRNLVPILTACSTIDSSGNDFKALVYELMPRGDLHKLLYSTGQYESSSDLILIAMAQRVSIVVDVADALEYVHHNNQETMIHCDLKPSNILLDDSMTAHVGDFGLARFKVGSTMSSLGNSNYFSVAVMGTIGYAAPDLTLIAMAQRISIVVDVADALEYVHHNNQETMIHCDLKPSNILLDDNMTAHVGDFGLARFKVGSTMSSLGNSNSSSVAVMGTIGYAAPEYAGGGQVSTAADVYSFGVVLLEIFVRRRPTDDMFKDGLNIVNFIEASFPGRVLEIVDPQLLQELEETPMALKEKCSECLLSMLKVGLSCTKPSPGDRINMQEVAAKLHGINDAYLNGN